jgi:hypothetical protein
MEVGKGTFGEEEEPWERVEYLKGSGGALRMTIIRKSDRCNDDPDLHL